MHIKKLAADINHRYSWFMPQQGRAAMERHKIRYYFTIWQDIQQKQLMFIIP